MSHWESSGKAAPCEKRDLQPHPSSRPGLVPHEMEIALRQAQVSALGTGAEPLTGPGTDPAPGLQVSPFPLQLKVKKSQIKREHKHVIGRVSKHVRLLCNR